MPNRIRQREVRFARIGKASYNFSPEADDERVTGYPLRTPTHFRNCVRHFERFGKDLIHQHRWGIKEKSLFADIPTIVLPWSFPPDILHLFKGTAVILMEHYNGTFFKGKKSFEEPEADPPAPNSDSSSQEEPAPQSRQRNVEARTSRGAPTRSSQRRSASVFGGDSPQHARHDASALSHGDASRENSQPSASELSSKESSDAAEEEDSEDDHIISQADWKLIGDYQDKSRETIPLAIGEVVNIDKYSGSMKADAWFSWILQQSPVFLKTLLPEVHYEGYMNFVRAAEMVTHGRAVTEAQIQEVDRLVKAFMTYYETKLYRSRWDRISACRVLIHQLCHVAESMRRLGPMANYWQFPIERLIGALESEIKNKSSTNAHLENLIIMKQQNNNLPFVLPMTEDLVCTFFDRVGGDSFFDANCNLRVTKLFGLAVHLDVSAQRAAVIDEDSDASTGRPGRKEPWFAPGQGLRRKPEGPGHPMPNLRAGSAGPRLPLAHAGEDSDDTDNEDPDFMPRREQMVNLNMVLGRPTSMNFLASFDPRHQRRILQAFLAWGWLPRSLASLKLAERKRILTEDMGIKRWRTLFVGKQRVALTNPMAFSMFEVTGSEDPHWFRKHSAANIHYNCEDDTGRKYTRFGKVLYFLSFQKPGLLNESQILDNDTDEEGSESMHIAVVERYKVVKKDCFLMVPAKSATRLEIIKTRWIQEPVGLIQWIDGNYITWHNGSYFGED